MEKRISTRRPAERCASQTDLRLLRDLAKRVLEIARLPEQAEKARLWKSCNDLKPVRPMVFMDPQGGWPELLDAWMHLECTSDWARGVEQNLRTKILRHEHMPDDFPITDRYPVNIDILNSGYDDYGIKLEVQRSAEKRGAYHIIEMIKSEEDLGKLHPRPIVVDHESADRELDGLQDLIGDILEVEKTGKTDWRYGLSRVLIHMRGLDQMMLDMYDRPDLIHKLMAFLRDDKLREIDIIEREGAVSLNNMVDSVTGSGGLSPTDDLPEEGFDGTARVKDCICWAESQETVGVGPEQFDEFVLQYQIPLTRRFGLTDYGCCEPLDNKLDLIIDKITNLRWVAVSPWADRALCAEILDGDYVYVYKPNPSRICSRTPDWDAAEDDIRETLRIARNCPTHIVMKDTATFFKEPYRATRWCRMAVRLAKEIG